MQRVQKLLSNYGYCSRRKAEQLIAEGKVKVNGKVISLGDKASADDKITVNGKLVRKEKKVYIMLNKPQHCVTALKDTQYKTVMDHIRVKERVFPVGRLDYNTTGLLLLTNDGDFANKVMHPRNETKKTYLVEIHKPITNKEIQKIEKGVQLEDGKTSPAKIKKHNPGLLEITIHEGKNRIIKRMFQELGFKVLSLSRIKIGNLGLEELKLGQWRYLGQSELKKII